MAAKLATKDEAGKPSVVRAALKAFVQHGARYCFPATQGALSRGVPTGYAASPLNEQIRPGNDPPPVWPWKKGTTRGTAFHPLYPSVPEAAQRNPALGCAIRIVTAPVFLATKLEAFRGRGQGNFLFSHDLEDLMAVVEGRAALLEECRLSPPELRNDLAAQFHELLNTSAFLEALPAFLPPDQACQQRLPDLLETLRAITTLAEP